MVLRKNKLRIGWVYYPADFQPGGCDKVLIVKRPEETPYYFGCVFGPTHPFKRRAFSHTVEIFLFDEDGYWVDITGERRMFRIDLSTGRPWNFETEEDEQKVNELGAKKDD